MFVAVEHSKCNEACVKYKWMAMLYEYTFNRNGDDIHFSHIHPGEWPGAGTGIVHAGPLEIFRYLLILVTISRFLKTATGCPGS